MIRSISCGLERKRVWELDLVNFRCSLSVTQFRVNSWDGGFVVVPCYSYFWRMLLCVVIFWMGCAYQFI